MPTTRPRFVIKSPCWVYSDNSFSEAATVQYEFPHLARDSVPGCALLLLLLLAEALTIEQGLPCRNSRAHDNRSGVALLLFLLCHRRHSFMGTGHEDLENTIGESQARILYTCSPDVD
jgi:hypothetical protein